TPSRWPATPCTRPSSPPTPNRPPEPSPPTSGSRPSARTRPRPTPSRSSSSPTSTSPGTSSTISSRPTTPTPSASPPPTAPACPSGAPAPAPAAAPRLTPLRRRPAWTPPDVILAVDPDVRASLPDEVLHRQRLVSFARARSARLVETRQQLAAALEGDRPYLLYWLSHAPPDALALRGHRIRPAELMPLLRPPELMAPLRGAGTVGAAGRRGLLFLNACRTGKGGRAGSFLDAVFSAGLSGLIATEEFTLNTFCLDFLMAFLDSGECVGRVLA